MLLSQFVLVKKAYGNKIISLPDNFFVHLADYERCACVVLLKRFHICSRHEEYFREGQSREPLTQVGFFGSNCICGGCLRSRGECIFRIYGS